MSSENKVQQSYAVMQKVITLFYLLKKLSILLNVHYAENIFVLPDEY